MANPDPRERFSNLVEDYVKYRPEYPDIIISFLESKISFSKDWIIADIGAGTGKSSRPFIENGNRIIAVEPNKPMREASLELFSSYPNFSAQEGTAESTNLSARSVDLIIVAQTFHWLDILKTKVEFQRILKSGGWVLLLWNKRNDAHSEFMKSYNDFLDEYSTDYQEINLRRIDEKSYNLFFGKNGYQETAFDNHQQFDFTGLKGRYLSSSYAFGKGHPLHSEAINSLKALFDKHQTEDNIQMAYNTELYFGQLD